MSRRDGHTEFGGYYEGSVWHPGWTIRLQAKVIPEERGYDQAQALYDDTTVYDSSDPDTWVVLDCQVERVTAGHGGRVGDIPGVRASLGTLRADLYDPQRLLDPKVSPYSLLARPGAPVRLVAISPTDPQDIRPLWTGESDEFTHDLLTGQGFLSAHDLVGRFAGVTTAEWTRPNENSRSRYLAINNMVTKPLPYRIDGTVANLCASKIAGDLWSAGFVKVAETEQAVLWVDQTGTLRRRDLDSGWGDMLLLGDCDTGVEDMIYTRLTSTVTDELLVNNVLTERVSIGEVDRPLRQRANVTSINWYGAATLTNTALQVLDDAALATWMQRVLDLRANPRPVVTGLVLRLADGLTWTVRSVPTAIALEVGRALDIRLSSRGTASRWLMIVAGITHSITPDSWDISLELADGTPALDVTRQYFYDSDLAMYDNVATYDVTKVSVPIP